MESILSQEQITPFVRQVLGCQCPQELFEQIETSIEQQGGLQYQRILIGQHLLVYLLGVDQVHGSYDVVSELLQAGITERDRQGYNRMRLVLLGSLTQEQAAVFVEAVKELTDSDPKAHLHLIASV